MESDFGFTLADHGTRTELLNSLSEKLEGGYLLKDERLILELVLLLHGRNTKLLGSVIDLLAKILDPNSYCHFIKVIPHLTDFLGVANEETFMKLQKVYTEFFRLSHQKQTVKIIKDGLEHPSWKVKHAMMKIFDSLDGIQDQVFYSIKGQLKSLLSESKEPQVKKHAEDIFKKMKMVVNQPFGSQIIESNQEFSKKFKVIDGVFEECLLLRETQTNTKILKADLASVPDASGKENVKLKIRALIMLRSGIVNFNIFAGVIRNILKHQHPEVVKEAVITLTVLILKKRLMNESEDYIQLLIQCLGNLSESVSMFAFVALQRLIKAFPTRAVLVNTIFNVNSESPAIRRKISHLILDTLGHFARNVLESSFLGLEQSMEYGINDKDSEVQDHWRRIFIKFNDLFERMAKRISFIDGKESEIIIRQKSSAKDPEAEDHKILNDMKLSELSVISSGHSIVINARFLGNKVVIRKLFECDEQRIKREQHMFKLTCNRRGFTPLLHELKFMNMIGFVMPRFELNLGDAIVNGILQKEVAKVKVIQDIAKALEFIHSQGFVYNSLEPKNVLLHLSNDSFVALLRNFGRSGLESETPVYPPSIDWTAPEALASPGNFSKASDVYSLGVVCYFVLSSGCEYKNKKKDIKKDLKLSKPHLGCMAISFLTLPVNDRPTARLFQIFPMFWKRGSYRFYVERLRELFRRDVELMRYFEKRSMKWTHHLAISKELKEDMAVFRNYKDNQVDLIMFLRNLSLHGRQSEVKRSVCGDNNELLEGWIEANFESHLMEVFEGTFEKYDKQLISELLSITM